jgi:pimeloyl-ACP methyl ester carboxylesterase
VAANILRGSARTALASPLIAVAVVAGFRIAAAVRETGLRSERAPSTGRLVTTSSGGVFLQEKGPADGVAVVLFHGTAAWSELWRRTIDALAAGGFRVIALDLPPFGFSERPGTYSRQDQAERVSEALRQIGVRPAIIVGHSFGAGAATELVMRHPNQARALVLVDAALGLTAPPSEVPLLLRPKWLREVAVSLTITNPLATKTLLQSLIEKKDRALPEYIEILQRPTTLRSSTADIADWLNYFLGDNKGALSANRNSYPGVKVPVAMIWGDKDTVTPLDQATDLRTLMPQTRLTLLPGVGHIPQIEDPDAFNAALLSTIKTF